jgi:hypothetical protein
MDVGMQLVVLEHNENVDRAVARTKNEEEVLVRVWSKATRRHLLKPVKVAKTFDFRASIWEVASELWSSGLSVRRGVKEVQSWNISVPQGVPKPDFPDRSEMLVAYERKKELAESAKKRR